MSTLTVNVNQQVKQKAKQRSQQDGVTLTFVINQLLKAYSDQKIQFEVAEAKTIKNKPKVWLVDDYLKAHPPKKTKESIERGKKLGKILKSAKKHYDPVPKEEISEIDKICYKL